MCYFLYVFLLSLLPPISFGEKNLFYAPLTIKDYNVSISYLKLYKNVVYFSVAAELALEAG